MLSEKTVWTIVKSIFALVLLALLFYVCQGGVQFLEVIGVVVFCAGLAWMLGLGEKYYIAEAKGSWKNTGIAAALCLAGLALIWAM
jgi:hypothetical protein